jgi:hypothetical protein
MTKSIDASTRRPRATRFESNSVTTIVFSVEPAQMPSGVLVPSIVTPRAISTACPANSMPSMKIATRSTMADARRALSLPFLRRKARKRHSSQTFVCETGARRVIGGLKRR